MYTTSGKLAYGTSNGLYNPHRREDRKKQLKKIVRKTYKQPEFTNSSLVFSCLDWFYWYLRSIQFKLCFHYTEPEEINLENDMPLLNIQPPSLDVLCAETKFSKAQLKYLYQAFKTECPNGRMTRTEFAKIYGYFFPNASSEEYSTRVFNAFDKNGNGVIDFREMVISLSDLWYGSDENRLLWAFLVMDSKRSGYVEMGEFITFVNSIFDLKGVQECTNVESASEEIFSRSRDFFKILDRDNDGRISWDDFETVCKKKCDQEMFAASRRATMPNVHTIENPKNRRPSQFQRAVRRHYAATEPNFDQSKLASSICQQIYWAFRSLQYMLCYHHIELEDEEPEVILSIFPVRPPSLQELARKTNFDIHWIKLMYAAFKKECPLGRMTLEGFVIIFRYFYPNSSTNSYAQRVFKALDEKKAGELTFEDLLLRLAEFRDSDGSCEIEFAQKLLNPDSQQHIYFDDFLDYTRSVFELIGIPDEKVSYADEFLCPVSEEHIEHRARLAFEQLDQNHRGRLTRKDFDNYFANLAFLDQLKSFKVLSPRPSNRLQSPKTPESILL